MWNLEVTEIIEGVRPACGRFKNLERWKFEARNISYLLT
jgi:hypothetical protein